MDTDFAKISNQYHQSELCIKWRRIKSEKLEKIKLRKKNLVVFGRCWCDVVDTEFPDL